MKLNPYFRTFMRLLWFQESWNGNIFFVENSERIRYRNIRITVVPKSFKCKYFSTRLHAQYESISESQNIPIHPWYTRQFSCHRDRGRRGDQGHPRLRHRQALNFPGDTDGKWLVQARSLATVIPGHQGDITR